MSLLVGGPIPTPSILDISQQTMAFVNLLSLLITLLGSIIGVGFYLERRTNLKFDNQTLKMNEIRTELKEIIVKTKESFHNKIDEIEKTTEYKVQKAKEIEDEKFKRIDEAHKEHERRLDTIDRDSYDYKIRHSDGGGNKN